MKKQQKEEIKTATEMMVKDMQEEEYYRIKHTPSDTFIEGIIKKFREQFVASDNRFLTGTETVGKAEKFIRQSFKSSLQSQRQSILEEIEKKKFNELINRKLTEVVLLEDIKEIIK